MAASSHWWGVSPTTAVGRADCSPPKTESLGGSLSCQGLRVFKSFRAFWGPWQRIHGPFNHLFGLWAVWEVFRAFQTMGLQCPSGAALRAEIDCISMRSITCVRHDTPVLRKEKGPQKPFQALNGFYKVPRALQSSEGFKEKNTSL